MKKLLSLLSVLTISGTAVPTTIAASPYKKQETIKNNDINLQTSNLLIRNKRNSIPKEQLEFINNNFFHKFNINYNGGKKWGFLNDEFVLVKDPIVLINDWTQYAKNWEEFERKFPEIEFINFKSNLGGQGSTVIKEKFKISTFLNKDWNGINLLDMKEKVDENFRKSQFTKKYPGVPYDLLNYKTISIYDYSFIFCKQHSSIDLRLYLDGKKLIAEHYYEFSSDSAVNAPWAELKYDSIRLIGDVDTNPLIILTVNSYNNLQKYIEEKQKEFLLKQESISYDKKVLNQEKNVFNIEIKSKLLDIMHNFIQDLLIIENQNKIEELRIEINELKRRIEALEKSDCISNIIENVGDENKTEIADKIIKTAFNKISKNNNSIGIIAKNTGKFLFKNFSKGLIIGAFDCIL